MQFELTTDKNILAECAKMMSLSEPWLTLKRDFNQCLDAVHGDDKEVYITKDSSTIAGFVVLQMSGTFRVYIRSICVNPDCRNKGIGSSLLKFSEDRIFQISPNVFMCVSSFNTEAAKLYSRLGYEKIGELQDFITLGHSEILLRKTIGPINEFVTK